MLTGSQQPAPRSLCAGLPTVTTFPGRRRNADLIEKTFKEEFWRAARLGFGSHAQLLAAEGSLRAPAGPGYQHKQKGFPQWEQSPPGCQSAQQLLYFVHKKAAWGRLSQGCSVPGCGSPRAGKAVALRSDIFQMRCFDFFFFNFFFLISFHSPPQGNVWKPNLA